MFEHLFNTFYKYICIRFLYYKFFKYILFIFDRFHLNITGMLNIYFRSQ